MKHWRLVLFVLLITAYTDTLFAKMYKWVDQNGKVTYSNVAPPSSAQQVKTSKETGENHSHQQSWEEPTKEQIENAKKNITKPRIVPISLSGTVVDSRGNAVSNVRMTIKEARMDPRTWEHKRTRRRQMVNGRFEVGCQDCSDVRLRFQADGFYPEEIGFTMNEAEKKAWLLGHEGDGLSFDRKGVVVRLRETKKNPVNLHWASVNLQLYAEDDAQRRYGESNLGTVLWFNPKRQTASRSIKREILKKRKMNGNNGPPMIALEAPSSQFDKLFKIAKRYSPSNSKSQMSVYLDFSGPQTGVIPANVPESESYYKKIYQSLAEAPSTGYTNRFMIDPYSTKRQYFFCRIGGLYGKGSVTALDTEGSEVRKLQVGIEIYLNHDGSRNLDALDY